MEKSLVKSNRVQWIDVARGLAVFIVVFGHAYISEVTFKLLYSFHMPLFFIISGLTVNKEKLLSISIWEYTKKMFKRLIVPYLWIQFLSFGLWHFVYVVKGYSSSPIVCSFWNNFFGIFCGNTGFLKFPSRACWFFLTMFIVMIGYRIILQIAKKDDFKELCLILFCLIIFYAEKGISLPWHFSVAFTGIVFVFIGTKLIKLFEYIKSKISQLDVKSKILWIFIILGVVAATLVLQLNNGRVSLAANNYGNSIIAFYVVAFVFSVLILFIVSCLPNIRPLSYVGRNTFVIVGLHKLIMQALSFYIPLKDKNDLYQFVFSIILFAALIPLAMLVNKLAPYVAGNAYKGGKLQEISKYFVTALAAIIPIYYIMKEFTANVPLHYLFGVTIVFSACFVIVLNRFAPVFFSQDKK